MGFSYYMKLITVLDELSGCTKPGSSFFAAQRMPFQRIGVEKVFFVLRDKKGDRESYPLFEKGIGEVILNRCNGVSTGALASTGIWGIDVQVTIQKGRLLAMLRTSLILVLATHVSLPANYGLNPSRNTGTNPESSAEHKLR